MADRAAQSTYNKDADGRILYLLRFLVAFHGITQQRPIYGFRGRTTGATIAILALTPMIAVLRVFGHFTDQDLVEELRKSAIPFFAATLACALPLSIAIYSLAKSPKTVALKDSIEKRYKLNDGAKLAFDLLYMFSAFLLFSLAWLI